MQDILSTNQNAAPMVQLNSTGMPEADNQIIMMYKTGQ